MTRAGIRGLLVTRPENRRYLSGYTARDTQIDESSGRLLVTPGRQYLVTDFRYRTQAEVEARGYEVVMSGPEAARTIGELARRTRLKSLGYEEDLITVKFFEALHRELPDIPIEPAAGLLSDLRLLKDAGEIKKIRRALGLTEKALRETWAFLKPGRTEIEVARFLEEAMVRLGAEGPAFESIVASGPNAALPHAVPTRRKIGSGETIIFDCGARLDGYGADISRTIVLGRPKSWIKTIYRLVRQAQLTAIRGIKPGLTSDRADALARDVIEAAGFGPNFGHALGHGVGMATHEAPALSRFRSTRLEPGMVVTVEPGIYIEGRGGVRLEEMVMVTEKSVRLLNRDRTFYEWPEP